MDIELDRMSMVDLKGLPAELLLKYYNQLAKEVGSPTRDVMETPAKLARRITTLRGVRYAQGMEADGPANLVVHLTAKPSEELTVGKRHPQGTATQFNRYPGDQVTRPGIGLRLKALELLETGCTPDDVEFLVIQEGDPATRSHTRYRALELIRVLNYRNGWGFYEDVDGKIYATDDPEEVDAALDELAVL